MGASGLVVLISTSPLTIMVCICSGAMAMICSKSGICSDSRSWESRCPLSHLNTGNGVSTLPEGA